MPWPMSDSTKMPPYLDPEQMARWTESMGGAQADPMTAWRHALDAWGEVLKPVAEAGRDKVDPQGPPLFRARMGAPGLRPYAAGL